MDDWFSPLRTIDPTDEDWSDLAHFGDVVGDCDLVLLGEAGHGDGSTFLAKTRLIKYLHQVHGFDVLTFEAGFYSCEKAHAALIAGGDPWAALDEGLHSVWLTEELRELVEYVDATYREGRPLRIAGFDCQFSSMATIEKVADDLAGWFTAIDSSILTDSDVVQLDRLANSSIPFRPQLTPTERAEARRVLHRLRDVHRYRREELEAAWGRDTTETIGQVLLNFDENDEFTWFINRWVKDARSRAEGGVIFGVNDGEDLFKALWNIRDTLQADNLRWHMDTRFAGRKVIAWLATGHAIHGSQLMRAEDPERFSGLVTMGDLVSERLGRRAYCVGVNSHDGVATLPSGMGDLPSVESGSLEDVLHGMGAQYAFADLRGLPEDHELRAPRPGRIFGNLPRIVADWSRVTDGVLFIDSMAASTPRHDR